jgi:deoxyhypusine monooxygenase
VFGQLQHEASIPSLINRLQDESELAMVRHECAEALGSIATDDCLPVLQRYRSGNVDRVVRESCEVGLDMLEWERSAEMVLPLQ